MLDKYTDEAYSIATNKWFADLTLEALYKGPQQGHLALAKMMRKEVPHGLLVIETKADYDRVDWIQLSRELEKEFKRRGMWNPPEEEKVKVSRKVGDPAPEGISENF